MTDMVHVHVVIYDSDDVDYNKTAGVHFSGHLPKDRYVRAIERARAEFNRTKQDYIRRLK